MNICIVTVYNSQNCGSFYQAYALSKTLEKQGHQVSFLRRNTKGTSHSFRTVISTSLKTLLSCHPVFAVRNLKTYFAFESFVDFKIIENASNEFRNIDCFIIGSDTLWNFDDKYFHAKKNIYSGLAFAKKKITYAVSVSNTRFETLDNDSLIVNGIKSLDAISVRDNYTKDIVKKITNTEPSIVLDPTFLLNESEYHYLTKDIKERGYILIYAFKEAIPELKEQLLKLKKNLGCKIISYGIFRKWADISTIYNPSTFLSYFYYADYVVTDTYHGTAFSIIFKKNFICYGQQKNKVRDLLTSLNLFKQFFESDDSVLDKLIISPDYDKAYQILEKLKKDSFNFLYNYLAEGCFESLN